MALYTVFVSKSQVWLHQNERAPTFVPLPISEKGGKGQSKPNIVDWARKCPVLWAEKLTHEVPNNYTKIIYK